MSIIIFPDLVKNISGVTDIKHSSVRSLKWKKHLAGIVEKKIVNSFNVFHFENQKQRPVTVCPVMSD